MKIIKSGKVICELPEEPKNFDGGCKGVKVWMTVGDDEIVLSHYESEVIRALHDAYFSGADEFDLA